MNTYRTSHLWRAVVFLVAAVAMTGCIAGSKPVAEEFRPQVEDIKARLQSLDELIDAEKDAYEDLSDQGPYQFTAEYSEADRHEDVFETAETKLKEAKTYFDETVQPLTETYSEQNETALELASEQQYALLAEVERLAKDPVEWIRLLGRANTESGSLQSEAANAAAAATNQFDEISPIAEQAKSDFPHQAQTIDIRYGDLATLRDSTVSGADGLANMTAASSLPAFVGLYKTTMEGADQLALDSSVFKSDLEGLHNRETRTLIDLRADTAVTIGRSSWDNGSDYGEEYFVFPPVFVTPQAAEVFAGLPAESLLARDVEGDGDPFEIFVDQAAWAEIGIASDENSVRAGADGNHTHFEFYVEDVEDYYCQKLQELSNGEPSTNSRPDPSQNYCSRYDTDADLAAGKYWVEEDELGVSEIGMDVYSKGYGDFPDQANEEASPPGMVYVGDPATGEWREDENGNSFWYYYGQYAFFNNLIGGGTPYHYRREYDEWNSGYRYAGKPYYAPDSSGTPRYGGTSPLTQSGARFAGTTYVASGLQDATVRNAGVVARAGGPGGGGK